MENDNLRTFLIHWQLSILEISKVNHAEFFMSVGLVISTQSRFDTSCFICKVILKQVILIRSRVVLMQEQQLSEMFLPTLLHCYVVLYFFIESEQNNTCTNSRINLGVFANSKHLVSP